MRNRIIIVSIFTLFIMFSGLVYGAVSQVEREALIALYNSTNGDNWDDNSGWKTDGDFSPPGTENTWYGITVSGDHVTKIKLLDNSLAGNIPTELGTLSNLTFLDLHSNQLRGRIPPDFGYLSALTYLDLHYNQLTEIPIELGALSNLEYLFLDRNQLTEIPSGLEWGNLSNLKYLYLYSNRLTGFIPTGLGNLINLKVLYLHNNELKGSIPPELGNLANLTRLYLHANRLEGEIPPQLGSLANLQYLYIHGNRLKGDIPSDIASLTNLIDNQSDFRWNALYTGNESLRDFLNSKQDGGDWESTQTIAPKNVDVRSFGATSIEVSWNPITYSGDTGGYTVYYNTTSGEPYEFSKATGDKTVSQIKITGLSENTTYYFAVKTQTDPHSNNQNRVESEYSEEKSETTSEEITISGRVTGDGTEAGLPGVSMTFHSDDGGIEEETTDADGYYNHIFNHEWSGTVTPSKEGYTFFPPSRSYENVTSDLSDQDYTAAEILPVISGRVTVSTDTGIEGLPSVTLTFASDSGGTETEITDADGYYNHPIDYRWTGTVTPSKIGYTFSPSSQSYENVNSDQPNQDYAATSSPVISISGRVTTSEGTGLPGVILTFSNGGESTVTDSNGYYNHNVNSGWSGTVTPTKTGYGFEPANRPYENVTSDLSDQDYTAAESFPTISGRISDPQGIGISDVTLTFSNGGESTVTDSNGYYNHNVDSGWSGTVTPTKTGYEFEPPNRPYENVDSDKPNQDYIATATGPVISGKVTDSEDTGISGVTLTFSNDGGTAAADANGNYNHAVDYNWSGEVTPSKTGYNFLPASRSYENVKSDKPGQDYKAAATSPVISGRVTTIEGTGLPGVKLIFSPSGGIVYTNDNGNYMQTVRDGWSGTVTPSKEGYEFTPPHRSYNNVKSDKPGEDYSAAAIFLIISGRVFTAAGEGVPDVILTFSHNGGRAVTKENGMYIHGVSYGWSGTVTPSKKGYEFTPPHLPYNYVKSNKPGEDYRAAEILPVISGRVTISTTTGIEGLGGVTLTFSSDSGGSETGTTDDNGYYNHPVNRGWSGTVKPIKTEYHFTPHSQHYENVYSNRTGQNFTASPDSVILILQASREVESTLVIRKYYGKIDLTIDEIKGAPVLKYIICRKVSSAGLEEPIEEIPGSELQRGKTYTYNDRYLEENETYTYIAKAFDSSENVIGVSNEKTI